MDWQRKALTVLKFTSRLSHPSRLCRNLYRTKPLGGLIRSGIHRGRTNPFLFFPAIKFDRRQLKLHVHIREGPIRILETRARFGIELEWRSRWGGNAKVLSRSTGRNYFYRRGRSRRRFDSRSFMRAASRGDAIRLARTDRRQIWSRFPALRRCNSFRFFPFSSPRTADRPSVVIDEWYR